MVTIIPNIATTTPADRSASAIKRTINARWFFAGGAVAIGTILLVLAIPRTIAAWEAMPANSVLIKIRAAEQPTVDELRDSVRDLRRSVATIAASRRLLDLGTVEFLLVQALAATDPERAPLLIASEEHFTRGLTINPLDGLAWHRLAQVRQARNPFDGRSIVVALMQSLDMAPNMRPLWVGRTFGLILYRKSLTAEETADLISNLRTSWSAEERFRIMIVQALKQDAGALDFIESALASDVEALEEFRRLRAR
jgi:hypothetical protein